MAPKGKAKSDMDLMIEQDIQLMKPWGYLIESIKGDNKTDTLYRQRMTARILENQGKVRMDEATMSGDVATFQKYVLPLIRRIYPQLPIIDLVGVQPLSGPAGLVFTMEAKYATAKGPVAAGTTIYDNASTSYASSLVDAEEYRAAAGSSTNYNGNLSWYPVVPGSVAITVGAVVAVDDGVGTVGTLSGAGVASGTITYATGAVTLTLSVAATVKGNATYTYNSEVNTLIPEIELDVTEQAVIAQPRKLRAKWSPEAQQDLQAVHGVEGEATFVAEIAQAIQREISRAVVEQCRSIVPSGNKDTFSRTVTSYISYDEHKRAIIDKLIALSRKIYAGTFRGVGNVLVAGQLGADIIETLPSFVADSAAALEQPYGKIGTLNNRWKVLEDIYMDSTKILIGYKGATFMDTGVVYAPYVALMLDTFINPDDFKVRKGFLTRDAICSINGKFYAELTIS